MRVAEIQSTEFQPKQMSALGPGAATGVFDFRDPGNSENLVTTISPGESIIPKRFTEALRTGEASLGGGGNTYNYIVKVEGDVIGVPKDEFYKKSAQRMGELIQSGLISSGSFTGATS
jgi:hypothetical protein